MSSACRIGYLRPDGAVESIYCHWDGYPSGVGKTLSQHYRLESKVKDLIALGDISFLGETTEHSPEDWVGWESNNKRTRCYRDRGDSDIDATVSISEDNFWKDVYRAGLSYAYLFKDGKWEMR